MCLYAVFHLVGIKRFSFQCQSQVFHTSDPNPMVNTLECFALVYSTENDMKTLKVILILRKIMKGCDFC